MAKVIFQRQRSIWSFFPMFLRFVSFFRICWIPTKRFWPFVVFLQVASAQRARAHGEAMMKRCREAKPGKVNELSNHQFSGDISWIWPPPCNSGK